MDKKNLLVCCAVGIGSFALGCLSAVCYFNYFTEKVSYTAEEVDDEYINVIQVTDKEMEKGFIYTGGIKNERRYGYGVMKTPKGTIYEGEWVDNKLTEGIMITDKSEYNGQFQVLSPNGYGIMRYRDGSYYRGKWNDGVKTGIGLFVDSIGNESFGFWEKGLIDKKTMTPIDEMVYGIDLSHHNHINDWGDLAIYTYPNGRVYESKPEREFVYQPVDFIFIKATEGATHRDKDYLSNMTNAKKYHKVRGSYHFMHLTSSSVEDQVNNFLDYIVYEKGDLPPVLDIEVMDQAKSLGADLTRQKVLQWLTLVEERLGVRPIIYASANMKRDFLNTSEFADYDFWIAYYKDEAPKDIRYMIWQCTSKGKLYGHSGSHIDVNLYGGDNTRFSKLLRQYHTK